MTGPQPTNKQPKRKRHVPLRRCVVCRAVRPQNELLRLFKDDEGAWQFDLKRRAGGRGAWLCQDKASCHRAKALQRFFKQDAQRVAADAENIRVALGLDAATTDLKPTEPKQANLNHEALEHKEKGG